jgi:hypothetical protein
VCVRVFSCMHVRACVRVCVCVYAVCERERDIYDRSIRMREGEKVGNNLRPWEFFSFIHN